MCLACAYIVRDTLTSALCSLSLSLSPPPLSLRLSLSFSLFLSLSPSPSLSLSLSLSLPPYSFPPSILHTHKYPPFTLVSIEKAHQVSATTPTNTVYFTAGNTVELEWNPLSIFPGSSSSDWQVTISMYGLNLENENQGWELLHIFSPNSPNDGQESIVIPNDLDRNIEILPIVFEVSASVDPGGSVQSGTLYTELVRSGQKAGLWTAQYYYINPLVANRTGYYLCQSWYESESQSTAPQLLVEATMPCPPQEAQARAPNSGLMEIDYTSFYGNSGYRTQWLRTFHQDAATCFSTGDLRR